MKVDVYRNLNKDCFSVRSRETNNYGRVVGHCESITIVDAEFIVQKSGQKKVRKTGIKNVHAFVRGVRDDTKTITGGQTHVRYNPFETDHFVDDSGEHIFSAACVSLSGNGVVASKEF